MTNTFWLKNIALGLCTMTASVAAAQTPVDTLRVVEYVAPSHAFGQQGQLLIGGSSSMNLAGTYAKGTNELFGPSFTFSPRASVFVAKHLALGLTGDVGVSRINASEKTAWRLAVGPLVTASIPLSDRVSFLPQVAPVYARAMGINAVQLQMHADFALHASDHLIVSFGPFVDQDMYSSGPAGRDTTFGLRAGLLGWL